jgi:hypothetical protein
MSANVSNHRRLENQVADTIDQPEPEKTVAPTLKRVVEKLLPYTLKSVTFTVDNRSAATVEVSLTGTDAEPLLTIGTVIKRTVIRTMRDGRTYPDEVEIPYVVSVLLRVEYFKTLDASDFFLGKNCLCKLKSLLDTNGKLGVEQRVTMTKWLIALK